MQNNQFPFRQINDLLAQAHQAAVTVGDKALALSIQRAWDKAADAARAEEQLAGIAPDQDDQAA
jgi:hypothetical protein